jgi:hypothetical protein
VTLEKYQEGLDILDLRWVTARKLDSSMTCGVGIIPSRSLFSYLFSIALFKEVAVVGYLDFSSASH